jgi:hypothetical protein
MGLLILLLMLAAGCSYSHYDINQPGQERMTTSVSNRRAAAPRTGTQAGEYRTLSWDWQADAENPNSNVVFVVWRAQNPYAHDWQPWAVATGKTYRVVLAEHGERMMFTVTASNKITGNVSPLYR